MLYAVTRAAVTYALTRGAVTYVIGFSTGQPEITQIVTVADVSGSLHGKVFFVYDAGGKVGFYINNGAVKERSSISTSGKAGSDFITAGAGKYFVIYANTVKKAVWINTGTETEPAVAGVTAGNYLDVNIDVLDGDEAIAGAILSTLTSVFFDDSSSSGTDVNVEDKVAIAEGHIGAGDSDLSVSLLANGRAAATAPGGYSRTIEIAGADDATADFLASAMDDIVDSAWAIAAVGDTVTMTDSANGARLDAADVDTGFTITTTQQGS